MKHIILIAAAMMLSPSVLSAEKYSTTDTDIGTLMADPKAKAILEEHIPKTISNEQFTMAYSFTLSFIQSFDQIGELTDEAMSEIDAEFAKLAKE